MTTKSWTEDTKSLIIGAIILLTALLFLLANPSSSFQQEIEKAQEKIAASEAPFTTPDKILAEEKLNQPQAPKSVIGEFLKSLPVKLQTWKSNPFKAFYKVADPPESILYEEALIQSNTALEAAQQAVSQAAASQFQNESLNQAAVGATEEWQRQRNEARELAAGKTLGIGQTLLSLVLLCLLFALLFGIFQGNTNQMFQFVKGFAALFLLALFAYWLAAQSNLKQMGLGYALWAILTGIVISNSIGVAPWIKVVLQHELYIKTGLILLGAEVLFGKIMSIGLPGIFVAWVVTPIVLISTFIFGQKVLKIPSKTLNMVVSADMSVCGVSAAIATSAACRAKKEELTTAIGLSMIFTSVMMVVLPAFIKYVGIPEVLGGAWIGGTIDATGAVVAAGAFLGDKALNVAATIKMIQNILIGVIAFGVAVYWTTKVDKEPGKKVGINEIWIRFPKFILGFIGASILFSILLEVVPNLTADILIEKEVLGFTKGLRGWLFCLAFCSIGLSTNFKELRQQFSGGKPLVLYVCGQLFNLSLTLLMAWLMFYKVFPHITENI